MVATFLQRAVEDPRRGLLCWGPPGTGKTTTLVAAIVAILHSDPNAKVLACTPSNASADHLCALLGESCQVSEMIRVHSLSRCKKDVHEAEALRFSRPEGVEFEFPFPLLEEVKSYRVVVCTLSIASKLHGIGVPAGHFSHIAVDEAGQATEAELLFALHTATQSTKFLLAGDHKQLGPIIHSAACVDAGMAKSPFERLFEDGTLKTKGLTVMLHENYRSHPKILHVFNFAYDDVLVSKCGDREGEVTFGSMGEYSSTILISSR